MCACPRPVFQTGLFRQIACDFSIARPRSLGLTRGHTVACAQIASRAQTALFAVRIHTMKRPEHHRNDTAELRRTSPTLHGVASGCTGTESVRRRDVGRFDCQRSGIPQHHGDRPPAACVPYPLERCAGRMRGAQRARSAGQDRGLYRSGALRARREPRAARAGPSTSFYERPGFAEAQT